jgi:hypothetical protein
VTIRAAVRKGRIEVRLPREPLRLSLVLISQEDCLYLSAVRLIWRAIFRNTSPSSRVKSRNAPPAPIINPRRNAPILGSFEVDYTSDALRNRTGIFVPLF